MKFAGLFHRGKRTPKRFMMRLKVRAASGPGGMRGWCMEGVVGFSSASC